MAKSRLVLNLDTDLSVGTLRNILDDSPSRPKELVQKLINFLKGMKAGARNARMASGVVDSGSIDAAFASMTGTFTGSPTASETITINGVIITFVASASPLNNQVSLSGSPSTTTLASRLAAAINASTTDALSGVVQATSLGAVVTVSALLAGYIGNIVLLTDSATNFTWAGAATRLAGGSGCLPTPTLFYTPAPGSSVPTPIGPAVVNLGGAAEFALLSKSGITDVPTSIVTGSVGASPITGAAIGISCAEITGSVYAVDAAGPAPCSAANPSLLTTAVNDMQAAYTDAAGRTSPDFTNLGAGEIGGLTLTPGLYKWTTGVTISNNVILTGAANDTYIFQISGVLALSNAKSVVLSGGVQAKNIFWQVSGGATLGTTSHMEGTILSLTTVTAATSSTANSRFLAQTAITLDHTTVTKPV